jgi:hypothetical protein
MSLGNLEDCRGASDRQGVEHGGVGALTAFYVGEKRGLTSGGRARGLAPGTGRRWDIARAAGTSTGIPGSPRLQDATRVALLV